MFVCDKSKHLFIVPMKCASQSYVEHFKSTSYIDLSADKELDDIPLTGAAKLVVIAEKTGRDLTQYKKTLVVRDPVQWLVSGYRFQCSLINRKSPDYPKSFYAHLKRVKNDDKSDLFWSDHCSVMPDQYYFYDCEIVKLENTKLKHKVNVTPKRVPYPKLSNKCVKLIKEITKEYCFRFAYNIEDSIKYYNGNTVY